MGNSQFSQFTILPIHNSPILNSSFLTSILNSSFSILNSLFRTRPVLRSTTARESLGRVGAAVQRYAWPAGECGQAALPQARAALRGVPAGVLFAGGGAAAAGNY